MTPPAGIACYLAEIVDFEEDATTAAWRTRVEQQKDRYGTITFTGGSDGDLLQNTGTVVTTIDFHGDEGADTLTNAGTVATITFTGGSDGDHHFTRERRSDQALPRKLRRRCCAQRSMRRSMASADRTG